MEGRGDLQGFAPPPSAEVPYHDLWTKPFRENTDPSFLWLGPQHRDAFATLRAAVLQNAGLLLLTGDVGTGKTTLANALADSLRAEGVRVAKLTHACLHPDEFRQGIAQALELPVPLDADESVFAHLARFLREAYARREKVLLVIDEAQDLGPAFLDEIEGLTRAGREAGRGKVNVLNILLVGQTDLGAILGREGRVTVRFHLGPLAPDQVADYIAFRLGVAGADRRLFSADAIRAIAAASGGVPRLINRICDSALLVAARRNERVVSADVVRDAVSDLDEAVPGRHTARAHGRRARGGLGRMASTAAIALAIAVGISFYYGARTRDSRDDRLRGTLIPVAGAQSAVKSIRPAMAEHAAPVERATPTGASVDADVVVATSPPIEPPASAIRMEPVKPTRTRIATTVALPPRTWAPPALADRGLATTHRSLAIADRKPAESPAPSATAVATPSPRPIKGRSEEPDDPAAIINWLFDGKRSRVDH
jgi:general secretion pathway protein A